MEKNKLGERFEVIYMESNLRENVKILKDKETGVHYICNEVGRGNGITVLLGEDGNPVINKN